MYGIWETANAAILPLIRSQTCRREALQRLAFVTKTLVPRMNSTCRRMRSGPKSEWRAFEHQ